MTTIGNAFGLATFNTLKNISSGRLLTDDHLGVEVELEGVYNLNRADFTPWWKIENDNSLREMGREFVFAQPMFGQDVVDALNHLEMHCTAMSPRITDRCSVHVHLNVTDMTAHQLKQLIVLYAIIEPVMFAKVAPERKQNFYCTPLDLSHEYINRLVTMFNFGNLRDGFSCTIDSDVKYNAINVAPISTFGSVEFRHLEGTYNASKILDWINTILSLKRDAMQSTYTPELFEAMYLESRVEEFVRYILRDVKIPEVIPLTEVRHKAMKVAKLLATAGDSSHVKIIEPFEETMISQSVDVMNQMGISVYSSDVISSIHHYVVQQNDYEQVKEIKIGE